MGCNCNNHHNGGCSPDKYVDISKIKPKDWEDASAIIGMDGCGKVFPVNKPEYELTEEDRDKLDSIVVGGEGDKALYNDGEYKETYTAEQVDEKIKEVIDSADNLTDRVDDLESDVAEINKTLEDAVLYDSEDNVNLRKNIIVENGNQVLGKTLAGGRHNIAKVDNGNNIVIGDQALNTHIDSLTRPTVTAFNGENYQTHGIAYKDEVDSISENIDSVSGELTNLSDKVDQFGERVSGVETGLSDLSNATEAAFSAVNSELTSIGYRITVTEGDIAVNTSDIESIRSELNDQEHFRGYYATTDEITAIESPKSGDYAYNAETGTKWIYNGTTWANSNVPVPDQTVDAYDSDPLMDGDASPGTNNRYARGDHRHPSDTTKADKTDLNDYLPLSGNQQTSPIDGDVWMSTGRKVILTDSGNSYIAAGQDNAVVIRSTGVGGVDIQTPNGTVKANGKEVVSYESNDDINAKANIVLENDNKILGTDANGSTHNLIELSRFGIIDTGSSTTPFNIKASERPTVQLPGEAGAEAHGIAFVGDIETLDAEISDKLDAQSQLISQNASNISANTSDIESILSRLSEDENFRGWKGTTDEITSIDNPKNGDYAFNAQTNTVWSYNGTTWYDTGAIIPQEIIDAYDGLPLMDGIVYAGESNRYARGDHRHPTDNTRASVTELNSLENKVDGVEGDLNDYISSNDSTIDTIENKIASNTGNISTLIGRVSSNEANISTLQLQAEQIGSEVNDLGVSIAETQAQTDQNTLDIRSLESSVENDKHFRGYFLTTSALTQTQATNNDYAWNAETGTVWIYDGSVPSWTNTEDAIPSGSIFAYDSLPLVDGEASAGEINEYSRGDHRHPSDPTKANASDLVESDNRVSSLETSTMDLGNRVSDVEVDIIELGNKITEVESEIPDISQFVDTSSSQTINGGKTFTSRTRFGGGLSIDNGGILFNSTNPSSRTITWANPITPNPNETEVDFGCGQDGAFEVDNPFGFRYNGKEIATVNNISSIERVKSNFPDEINLYSGDLMYLPCEIPIEKDTKGAILLCKLDILTDEFLFSSGNSLRDAAIILTCEFCRSGNIVVGQVRKAIYRIGVKQSVDFECCVDELYAGDIIEARIRSTYDTASITITGDSSNNYLAIY